MNFICVNSLYCPVYPLLLSVFLYFFEIYMIFLVWKFISDCLYIFLIKTTIFFQITVAWFGTTFWNFGSSMLFTFVWFLYYFYLSVTDESYADETRVWRIELLAWSLKQLSALLMFYCIFYLCICLSSIFFHLFVLYSCHIMLSF